MLRGVRGAITVAVDREDEVYAATQELLTAMVKENDIRSEDIASVFFTATPDITSAFPAKAARNMGWTNVPLICFQEMNVSGALPLVIRILIHYSTERSQDQIKHVYLREAVVLRADLRSN